MTKPLFDNKKLQQVFEKIWVQPEEMLLYVTKEESSKKQLTGTGADTQLLALILNVLLQRFDNLDLKQEKLLAYYTTDKDDEKAALLTVWCMYGWILIGRLGMADKLRQHFAVAYSPEQTPVAYACYYAFSCVYSEKNGYYEDFMRLAQDEEDHLDKYDIEPTWRLALLNMALLYHSRTQSNYSRPEQATAVMQQVQQAINNNGLTDLMSEMVLYSYVMHYENTGQRMKAIAALEGILALTGKRKYSPIAKFGVVANLINTYNLQNRQLLKSDTTYQANRVKQLNWIKQTDNILSSNFVSATTAFYYYAKAGFYWQEGMLPEALQAIAKSILIFYRYGHVRFLAQAYTTAYRIYKTGAVAGTDYRMAYKAARCSDQMRIMTDRYYKQLLGKRIESLEIQHKLREKELNEALLQQQITAMNKEVQLTTLNLHEKIQVLDEIKVFVNSLKKKQSETKQLINTIARKIDSVKITEEEKATLQQKMGESNRQLSQILTQKYPTLSPLEIRMCGLFQSGMTNKELSKLYGQSEKSYEQHRYRIKKKMGIGAHEKLVNYLLALNTSK
ncbi:MAG: hypothetical protein U0T75_14525 [Chitinophagales bacterium]